MLRRQKDRAEQSKMEEELEEKKRKEEEEIARKKRKLATSRNEGAVVAKPGAIARNKRFMPKKRGRVGL